MKALRVTSSVALVATGLIWIVRTVTLHSQVATTDQPEYVAGGPAIAREVLIKLAAGADLDSIRQQGDADADRPIGVTGWRRVRSASKPVQTLLTAFQNRTDVLAVEPNYLVHTTLVPNDPLFPSLWGLLNASKPGSDIHATHAWDISTGSPSVVVGDVDTGVDYTHPDLAENMWTAPSSFTVTIADRPLTCPAGSHGFNALTFSCDPADDFGHGTHTSGTIGAVGNNGIGVVGVNWSTRIMGMKFLDSTGSGSTADAINAIEFAIQVKNAFAASMGANVRVLSNSWGSSGFSQALLDEVERASSADILFVAAAGNNSSNNDAVPFYPASFDAANVIAVAATDPNDALWGLSNYGAASVHIGAPGVGILSTWPGGQYFPMTGTSMATPHVSGAAALVLSACQLTTPELKSTILNNVDVLTSLTGLVSTNGRLNVDAAIRSCASPPTVTLSSPFDGTIYEAPATILFGATASGANAISRVEFYSGTTLVGTSTTSPYTVAWTNVASGRYAVTAKAYDVQGLTATTAPVHLIVNQNQIITASATFTGTDTTTQGSWMGVYGGDGFETVDDATNDPVFVTVTPTGMADYTWDGASTDIRALQRAAGTGRLAATWYGSTFSIDLDFTDGTPHAMAFYIVDWDSFNRTERFDIRDAVSGSILDSRTATAFAGGQYWRWTFQGHVTVQVTQTSGGGGAVVSGMFFGPPRSTAVFSGTDATTQGNWMGVYGGDGFQTVDDATNIPAYVTVTPAGVADYMWDGASTDIRALERAAGAGRLAATWYGRTFSIDLNFTDGATHAVAFYIVDWDSFNRTERFDVRDTVRGTILDSRTATGFATGQYWQWTFQGHVTVQVTQTGGGGGAVVSAVFFDAVPSRPTVLTGTGAISDP